MMNESPCRILLIEDSLADICLFRLALTETSLNCELIVLHDGGEALDFVHRRGKYVDAARPDLVILDLLLPKNSGIEVLEAIRATGDMRTVPAVVMTSVASPHDLARAEALGIASRITKPCDFKEFLKIGAVLKDLIVGLQRSSRSGGKSKASAS